MVTIGFKRTTKLKDSNTWSVCIPYDVQEIRQKEIYLSLNQKFDSSIPDIVYVNV
jgi:hypothetical protein